MVPVQSKLRVALYYVCTLNPASLQGKNGKRCWSLIADKCVCMRARACVCVCTCVYVCVCSFAVMCVREMGGQRQAGRQDSAELAARLNRKDTYHTQQCQCQPTVPARASFIGLSVSQQ